jgi:hypothetical protein
MWEDVEKIPTSFKGSYNNICPLVEKSEVHIGEVQELNSSSVLKMMIHALNEEGMAHGMNGRKEICIQSFGRISLRKNLNTDGRIILKCIL